MAPMAKSFNLAPLLLTLTCLFCCYSTISSTEPPPDPDGFFRCVFDANIPVFKRESSKEFDIQLINYARNARFRANKVGKPVSIVVPGETDHVKKAVSCGRLHGMPIRVRSGGHDYEGLSYRSVDGSAFAMLDMSNLTTVDVDPDPEAPTAWVDSGATLGELYYEIGQKSDTLGFPAGSCPTVGVGGQFTGGGFGMLMRKYGLSIDNIVDAQLVNAKGDLLNRDAMGEDVFWAIRGGSGGSFGVVVRWKVRLVAVPASVAVFNTTVSGSGDDARSIVDVLEEWQDVAPRLPGEVYMRALLRKGKTVDFRSMYLGSCKDFIDNFQSNFTLLKLTDKNCVDMPWVNSTSYVYLGTKLAEKLLNRTTSESDSTYAFKAKTDYVRKKIDPKVWDEIFAKLDEAKSKDDNGYKGQVVMVPYGGKMNESLKSPFPHRQGVLYQIQYYIYWPAEDNNLEQKGLKWLEEIYTDMDKYVIRPESMVRGAYANCRDLKLGDDYGRKYFEGNYENLTKVKAMFDPDNYFNDEQSIPLLPYTLAPAPAPAAPEYARASRLRRSWPLFSSY